MLIQITSLTKNGLKDWFVQRVSAVVLACYLLLIVGYVVGHHPLQYVDWYALFHRNSMKLFTIIALLALVAHCWVGIWTVLTDYVTCKFLRGTLAVFMVLALVAYFVAGILILWS
jgi:succinate dehydrogenase / fumarate reductase membrane anchor subunit